VGWGRTARSIRLGLVAVWAVAVAVTTVPCRAGESGATGGRGRLFLHVPADVREPGLEVSLDGSPVPSTMWGARLPVTLGAHEVLARAPGFAPEALHVTVVDAERNESVTLEPLSPAIPETISSAPSPASKKEDAGSGSGRTLRILSFVAVGAGVAGLGVGTVFGAVSAQKKSDADRECHPDSSGQSVCSPQGVSLRQDAIDAGNVSTVAFLAGAAGVVGATVLWLLSSEHKASARSTWQLRPVIGAQTGMLHWTGTW